MPLKKPEKKNECLSCKAKEGAARGSTFKGTAENGMVVTFWLCDPCAVRLSPGQGPITLQDPTTRV